MTDIRYIQSTERQVGEAHPTLSDTLNRALRDVLTASGVDPDADFNGFASGLSGAGSPEGTVTAGIGQTYRQTDGSNGSVLWVKNSGTGNTGWVLLQASLNIVNPLWYGAVGDGVTNDTAALAAAIAAVPAHGVLYCPPGKTFLTDGQVISTSMTVVAHGATFTLRTATSETGLLTFRGAQTATTATSTVAATAGDLSLTVDDATGFAAGDWVRVEDTAQTSTNFAYEFAKVYAVDATHLYLAAPLEVPLTYDVGTTITKLTPVTVTVLGGTFDGGALGGTNISLVQCDMCFDSRVEGAVFTNIGFSILDLRSSKHIRIVGCSLADAAGDRSTAAPPDSGYGVNPRLGTSHVMVTGSTFRGLRHGVIVSEGGHSVSVVGNTFHGMYGAALTTHFRRQLNCVFSQNVVTGDAYDSTASLTRGTASYGCAVSTTDTRVVIQGNIFSYLRGAAVRVAPDSTQDVSVTITGNIAIECYDPTSNSEATYYITNSNNVTLAGNLCLRTIDGGATAPACFRVFACRHATITGNEAIAQVAQTSSAVSGFRLGDIQEFTVTGNTAKVNSSGYGIRVDATSSGTSDAGSLQGNIIELISGTAFLLSANATNIQHIGNSWNTGSTNNLLLGGLTATLGCALPIGADLGNGSGTLTVGTSSPVQIENTALTNTRTIGLSTSGAVNGSRFWIFRTATSTGAFALAIGTGPLINLATSQWCVVEYNGSAWAVIGSGSLITTGMNPGVSADNGDTSPTLTPFRSNPTQLFATNLTANRTVTLSTTNAVNGSKFRIVRTGLGAFTLDVGGLKTIASATAAFVDVEYNGSAWVLTGYGAL